MPRLLALGLVLGLAGCGQDRQGKPPGKRSPVSVPAPGTAVQPAPAAEGPPRELPQPRLSAQEREVEAYLADPPITLTAPELLQAYQHEEAADKRFKDRKVWLTGHVRRAGYGPLGAPYVDLAPANGEGGLVRCVFGKGTLDAAALKENQEVHIEGRVAAKGGNQVRVNDCRLLTEPFMRAVAEEARRRKG
jgi:hypothetical protein